MAHDRFFNVESRASHNCGSSRLLHLETLVSTYIRLKSYSRIRCHAVFLWLRTDASVTRSSWRFYCYTQVQLHQPGGLVPSWNIQAQTTICTSVASGFTRLLLRKPVPFLETVSLTFVPGYFLRSSLVVTFVTFTSYGLSSRRLLDSHAARTFFHMLPSLLGFLSL